MVGGDEVGANRVLDRLDHAPGGDEALGEGAGEGAVLAHGDELGAKVGAEAEGDVARVLDCEVGAGEHPVAVDDDGLAAVHGLDGGRRLPRKGGFPDERELGVEHHTGRPAGDRRGRGVQADAARGPERDVGRKGGQQGLEQDERGQLAHPSARFGSPGDEAVGAGGEGSAGFVGRAHLDHDGEMADVGHRPRRVGGEDDGVHLCRQVGRLDRAPGGDPHAEGGGHPAGGVGQGDEGQAAVTAEIEDSQAAGPRHRCHQGRVGLGEGRHANDETATERVALHRSSSVSGQRDVQPTRVGGRVDVSPRVAPNA